MGDISYAWRGEIENEAVNALHAAAFDHPPFDDDWNSLVTAHSLGWVTATGTSTLVGFLNVVWDGAAHAWLQDVIVAPATQRNGVGTRMVQLATTEARNAGCEWLHVDFDEEHRSFYIDACGFSPAAAGLIELR